MFSQMIQNLLNSSGQSTAARRASQINNYANPSKKASLQTKDPLDMIYPPSSNSVSDFQKIMAGTTKTNFGSLLLNPKSLNVNGTIYDDDGLSSTTIRNDVLLNAIQEVNDARRDYSKEKTTSKSQILDMVNKISRENGIDERLVQALIKQESGFNPDAKSKAGAIGLMQLMPSTAKAMGVNNPYNPAQNVEGGVKYLKSMLKRYNGNVILALAAYNAGPNAVDKYDGIPPYKETQDYVKNILANYL